jgi:antitoxin HicB
MKKCLSYYKKMNYQIILRQDVDNGERYYVAEIPELQGCGSHGATQEEALRRLEEAKELWLKAKLKRGLPIPEPNVEENYSGKILVRIPSKLHMELIEKAKKENISLNLLIRNKLESVLSMEAIQKEIYELKKSVNELCLITQTTTEYNLFPMASNSRLSVVPGIKGAWAGTAVPDGSTPATASGMTWIISPEAYQSSKEKRL